MTQEDYNDAKAQQTIIDEMTSLLALKNKVGAKAVVTIVDADGNGLINASTLESALGAEYTTIASTALSSVGTKLSDAKTAAENAFGNI